jgi:S1-C subfamily serine protease
VLAAALTAGVAIATGAFSGSKPDLSSLPAPAAPVRPAPPAAPVRPWLGLRTTISPGARGALVTDVIPGGPVDQAGLQQGDVIMAINAQPVAGPADIAGVVDAQSVGTEVQLQIDRGGQLQMVAVRLGRRPAVAP